MSSTPFLSSLLVTFPGFTPAHASSLYEEGLREAADFAHVTAADVKVAAQTSGDTMQIVLAGKIKAAAEAAATSGDGRAVKAAALRTHVGNLASRDLDAVTAAVDALAALGVTHLPVDAMFSAARSQATTASGGAFVVVADVALELQEVSAGERHAAISAGVYRGLALRSLESFRPRAYLPRSPVSGELLQAGKDWRTGVEWGRLPRARLGLGRWMKLNGMLGGLSDTALLADLETAGPTSTNADAVRRARGVTDEQIAGLAEGVSTTMPETPAIPAGGSSTTALYNLLATIFSADEIRRLLSFLPDGKVLVAELPGATASLMAMASAAVEVLQRHGRVDDAFWTAVHAARPRRRDEIERARCGG